MSPAEIKQLKQDTMALRNLANKVLEQVQQWESKPAAPARQNKKRLERMAELQARLMSGRRKPTQS